jgi:energy-coupling factor transporter ATP-binding protein EcfA2
LKAAGRSDKLTEIVERVFPHLRGLKIDFDEVNERFISVTYKEQDHPREFDIFSAGSGFQQFVYLFGFILLRDPTVILLDEPDVHLHGSLQRVLYQEFLQLANSGKQILFATHSRDLIVRTPPESILTLDGTKAERLRLAYDVFDTLDRLGSVDPTQFPAIQAFRRVLMLEDRSDRELLSIFCSKVLGEAVWQEVDRRVAVCYAKTNPRQSKPDLLRQQLQQLVAVKGTALELFIVADRDYYPDLDYLRSNLQGDHLKWHVWERVEIENYLLVPDAVLRLVQTGELPLQETANREPMLAELNRLMDSSRNAANDRLVSGFQDHAEQTRQPWDAAALSRKAREFLEANWEAQKVVLADAKDVVLPGLKKWLQSRGLRGFTNKALADKLRKDELPEEVHRLAHDLARFAGVPEPV